MRSDDEAAPDPSSDAEPMAEDSDMLMTPRSLVTLRRMVKQHQIHPQMLSPSPRRWLRTLSMLMTLRSLVTLSRMMKQHQIHPQMLSPSPRRPRLKSTRGLKGVLVVWDWCSAWP